MEDIHNSAQLIELIDRIGFLPLLDSGIHGFSAEDIVAADCRYVVFPEGGWDWPLWKWKGSIITEGHHVSRGTMYMVSSLQARQDLSVVSGGQTSATIAATSILSLMREA